jgi:hypothetical protein
VTVTANHTNVWGLSEHFYIKVTSVPSGWSVTPNPTGNQEIPANDSRKFSMQITPRAEDTSGTLTFEMWQDPSPQPPRMVANEQKDFSVQIVPDHLTVSANPGSIPADGISVSSIRAAIRDKDGNVIPRATNPVTFQITSGGQSGQLQGSNPAIPAGGIAEIDLRATNVPGVVHVTASAEGMTGAGLDVAVTGLPSAVAPLVPTSNSVSSQVQDDGELHRYFMVLDNSQPVPLPVADATLLTSVTGATEFTSNAEGLVDIVIKAADVAPGSTPVSISHVYYQSEEVPISPLPSFTVERKPREFSRECKISGGGWLLGGVGAAVEVAELYVGLKEKMGVECLAGERYAGDDSTVTDSILGMTQAAGIGVAYEASLGPHAEAVGEVAVECGASGERLAKVEEGFEVEAAGPLFQNHDQNAVAGYEALRMWASRDPVALAILHFVERQSGLMADVRQSYANVDARGHGGLGFDMEGSARVSATIDLIGSDGVRDSTISPKLGLEFGSAVEGGFLRGETRGLQGSEPFARLEMGSRFDVTALMPVLKKAGYSDDDLGSIGLTGDIAGAIAALELNGQAPDQALSVALMVVKVDQPWVELKLAIEGTEAIQAVQEQLSAMGHTTAADTIGMLRSGGIPWLVRVAPPETAAHVATAAEALATPVRVEERYVSMGGGTFSADLVLGVKLVLGAGLELGALERRESVARVRTLSEGLGYLTESYATEPDPINPANPAFAWLGERVFSAVAAFVDGLPQTALGGALHVVTDVGEQVDLMIEDAAAGVRARVTGAVGAGQRAVGAALSDYWRPGSQTAARAIRTRTGQANVAGCPIVVQVQDDSSGKLAGEPWISPLNVEVTYTPPTPAATGSAGRQVSGLGAFRWNPDKGYWEPVATRAVRSNTVTMAVDGSGTYAVAYVGEGPSTTIRSPANGCFTASAKPLVEVQFSSALGVDPATISVVLDGTSILDGTSAPQYFSLEQQRLSFAPKDQLPTGPHTLTVDVSDGAGQAAARASSVFTVVSVAPRAFEGLQLISLPFAPTNPDFASLFQATDASPKVAWWNPGKDAYEYYPTGNAARATLGRGYWIRVSDSRTVEPSGSLCDPRLEYPVPLEPGWNMVGCPFLNALPWDLDLIRVRNEETSEERTLREAETAGWVEGYGWGWNPGTGEYVLVYDQDFNIPGMLTTLEPWRGYWVKAYLPCTLILPAPAGGASATRAGVGESAGKGGWQVQLLAHARTATDSFNFLGVAEPAHDGGGSLAFQGPPRAPAPDHVDLYFLGPSARERLAVDLRALFATSAEWEFVVETDIADAEVTLAWPDLSRVPKDVDLVLVDEETGARRRLRTTGSYVFDSGPAGGSRRFRIIAGGVLGGRLAITGLSAAPSKGGVFSISYSLSQAAVVDVAIYTLSGEVVARPAQSRSGGPGSDTVYWDGRGIAGNLLPAGTYLCELTARTEDGQAARAVRAVAISR